MKKVKVILGWLLGIFLIFAGIYNITDMPLARFLLIVAGLILIPLTDIFLEKKNIKIKFWLKTIISLVLFVIASFILVSTEDFIPENSNNNNNNNITPSEKIPEEEKSPSQKMLGKLIELKEEKKVFDIGNYIKGEIPKGEYVFIKLYRSGYYSETDMSDSIIDNENFDSFGYVFVHEQGDIEINGILIGIDYLSELGVSSAKELYEILNEKENYNQSGMYKVGSDISSGTVILESIGRSYFEINSGPVGKSNIINNGSFDGKKTVNLKSGQYLKISRAQILGD